MLSHTACAFSEINVVGEPLRPGSAGGRSARYWRRAPQAVDATVSLTPLQQIVLGREAIRRGLLPEQLHALIMHRVLEDGLVLAVLDE